MTARRTAFVTGADEFLGTELVRVLADVGHQVYGLAASVEAAHRVQSAGAVPVMGDLGKAGRWQDEAAADWVFHLPPHDQPRWRVTRKRAESFARARLQMDAHLLDAVANGSTRRLVYVEDTSDYETPGSRPITEDEPDTVTPALDHLDGYVLAGLPIVTTMPGRVYGNGGWFRHQIVEPIMAGRRLLQVGATGPWVSPIHVRDCARALVHLAEHGTTGGRYFVVNSDPIQTQEFARMFARLANRSLRVWRMPAWTARLLVGPGWAAPPHTDAAFANIRLRGTGFTFRYPTLEDGVRQVVAAL
jgi:hypothetical protein